MAFEIEDEEVFGVTQQVFKGSPRTAAGMYMRAKAFGSRRMVVQDAVCLTYDEVFDRAAALANSLREQFGVVRGTKVAMVMGNRAEWIISLVAITSAGGVAVLVNSRGAADEMQKALTIAGCELVILDTERAQVMGSIQPDPPWPRILIGVGTSLRPGVDGDFAALSVAFPGRTLEPLEMSPEDGALVLFTSGTTGFPKAALISHGALTHAVTLSGVMGALQDLRYEEEVGVKPSVDQSSMTSPVVILGPLFHLGGMLPVMRAMNFGATIFFMNKWNVDIAFDLIERERVSRLGFVPTMLWDMLRSPRAGPANIGSLLYLSNGAALLNPGLVAEIRARMPKCLLANTYGQSETTAWSCSISGQAYFDHPESCGWAPPTVNVRLVRDDGSEAAVGEPGELWVSSAAVMTEYLGDPDASAATLKDGWCASGDIAVVGENGLFSIIDRKKNMVISGGENIYCAEVERVLSEHPGVLEVMAYGLPDPRLGEKLVATVVAEPEADISEAQLQAHCKGHLAIYKVPRAISVTSVRLPRTATGKYDRGAFLKRIRQEIASEQAS